MSNDLTQNLPGDDRLDQIITLARGIDTRLERVETRLERVEAGLDKLET